MNEQELKMIDELTLKVDQHEKTISQLVEIIALTNRRLTEFIQMDSEQHNHPTHQKKMSSF